VVLWALGFVHASVRARTRGCGSGSSLTLSFQPVKTSPPPKQAKKLCGFINDNKGHPCLQVSQDKLSRAQALLRYVIAGVKGPLTKLTMTVVVGTLQSLVPATPGGIVVVFLDHVYRTIHHSPSNSAPGTAAFYHDAVVLDEWAFNKLLWWDQILEACLYRQLQVQNVQMLAFKWGDNSGTGIGGTNQFVDSSTHLGTPLELWMDTRDHGVILARWKGNVLMDAHGPWLSVVPF
jgi:hypothetical protein